MNRYISFFLGCSAVVGSVALLTGCATLHKPSASATASPSVEASKPIDNKGVKHKVRKGETLWRIARTYQVSVETITQANGIPNAASIEEDQLILIPGVDALRDVAVLSPSERDADYAWPVKGKVISYFQDRSAGAMPNAGIDIKAAEGDIVRAARDGRVVFVDHLAGYGQAIIIEHADGFFTVYGHNARSFVKLDDKVLKGEKLAQVARDGGLAYLHFEVRKGDRPTNPLHYLP